MKTLTILITSLILIALTPITHILAKDFLLIKTNSCQLQQITMDSIEFYPFKNQQLHAKLPITTISNMNQLVSYVQTHWNNIEQQFYKLPKQEQEQMILTAGFLSYNDFISKIHEEKKLHLKEISNVNLFNKYYPLTIRTNHDRTIISFSGLVFKSDFNIDNQFNLIKGTTNNDINHAYLNHKIQIYVKDRELTLVLNFASKATNEIYKCYI